MQRSPCNRSAISYLSSGDVLPRIVAGRPQPPNFCPAFAQPAKRPTRQCAWLLDDDAVLLGCFAVAPAAHVEDSSAGLVLTPERDNPALPQRSQDAARLHWLDPEHLLNVARCD